MLANFSTGVETKAFGSSELKKKNERGHFFSSDPSGADYSWILQFSQVVII